METVDLVVSEGCSKLSPGSSVRKLKQSQLQFQVLSPGATNKRAELAETRKRKLSADDVELGQLTKIVRVPGTRGLTIDDHIGKRKNAEEEKTGRISVVVSTDQLSTSGSTTNEKKLKKRYTKKSKKHDQEKILIKLPIGKRKRAPTSKLKPTKKNHAHSDLLKLNAISCDTIQLDDSDLSEENERYKTVDHAEECVLQTTLSETCKNLKNQSKNTSKQQRSANKTMMPASIISELAPTRRFRRDSLSPVSSNGHVKKAGGVTLANFLNKVEEPNKISEDKIAALLDKPGTIPSLNLISEVDSSEEDIYMLCTPNSNIMLTTEQTDGNLSPKQIARQHGPDKRTARKLQQKEEKRRKLLEEKEEKVREREEQERQRRRERQEKEEQKRKEREERDEQKRKEREEKEEIKRKERVEKEEQKRMERAEKEKKRQIEMDQKNEEKRQREKKNEEERRKKEDQKEEERKRKEEVKDAEQKRKQKVAQVFTSFFVKKNLHGTGIGRLSDDENSAESSMGGSNATGIGLGEHRFMPFCVKGDMRLAPITRKVLGPVQKRNLEQIFANRSGESEVTNKDLYLGLLRRHLHKPLKTSRTWSTEEDKEEENDDILIVDDSVCHQIEKDPRTTKQKLKAKFFLFEENRRPPFRGTWRKRSSCICARRPFIQDLKYFDYEVDSDDEWEEEEPGESLHGSDDEKDFDQEEDYEVDNEFFVPHGHLSDEELQAEEEGLIDADSPEAQKTKLKVMQQEFVAEMKKKTEKIKPMLIGCIWENVDKSENEVGVNDRADYSVVIWKLLNDRGMVYDTEEPFSFTFSSSSIYGIENGIDQGGNASSPGKENEKGPKKIRITDDAVRDLVRLVHGNVNNRKFLVREFQAFWSNRNATTQDRNSEEHLEQISMKLSADKSVVEFSVESIKNKIREIAEWGACPLEGPMMGKLCWTVTKDMLEQYDLRELKMPNDWKYLLRGNKQVRLEPKTLTSEGVPKQQQSRSKTKGKMQRARRKEVESTTNASASIAQPPAVSIKQFTTVLSKNSPTTRFAVMPSTHKKEYPITESGIKSELEQASNVNEIAQTYIPDVKDSDIQNKPKKRVQLLMSVPRGHSIKKSTKNNLISQLLANNSSTVRSPEHEMEVDCIDSKKFIVID